MKESADAAIDAALAAKKSYQRSTLARGPPLHQDE